jgi:hypothetical protein
MALCTSKECKRCDIGFIIKDYVRPLMQALSVHLQEYNMQLMETKCLNTAVMMMYLLFGTKSLQHTRYCDVPNVVKRHLHSQDNSITIANNLKTDILRKTKHRYIYYVMLTDGYFVKDDGSKVFFPGHVFLIEKVPNANGSDMEYFIYQSYINEYTLETQVAINQKMKVKSDKIWYYMDNICRMTKEKIWDENFTEFWKDMTHVDTKQMNGSRPLQAFYVCFQKVQHKKCAEELIKFSKFILTTIPKNLPSNIYGKSNTVYHENSEPLTNKQMEIAFTKLINRLTKM